MLSSENFLINNPLKYSCISKSHNRVPSRSIQRKPYTRSFNRVITYNVFLHQIIFNSICHKYKVIDPLLPARGHTPSTLSSSTFAKSEDLPPSQAPLQYGMINYSPNESCLNFPCLCNINSEEARKPPEN